MSSLNDSRASDGGVGEKPRLVHLGGVLQVLDLLALVHVLAGELAVCVVGLSCPRALSLNLVDPVLHCSLSTRAGRGHALLLLSEQVVDVAPQRVVLELSIHEFLSKPVLLPAARQSLASIYRHDMARNLPPAIQMDIGYQSNSEECLELAQAQAKFQPDI